MLPARPERCPFELAELKRLARLNCHSLCFAVSRPKLKRKLKRKLKKKLPETVLTVKMESLR